MRKFALFLLLSFCVVSAQAKINSSVPASVKKGVITLKTPARAKGQQDALKLTADPIETVRVGFVGTGMRGSSAVVRFTFIEGAQIAAICDLEQSNLDKVQEKLAKKGHARVDEYVGPEAYKELCMRDDIDLIYICTDWNSHTPIAVYAMEHGKHVAIEVPAAMSIKQCWQLIDTCEKTRKHCMMLENCVYDFFEMATLNMAQKGLFGEVYYAEGGYIHNLDVFWDMYHQQWRLKYNSIHRGDNYPTHGIGPLCQALDIHRGDRMASLVSMDTKALHGAEVAKERLGVEDFADGDYTTTLIRTAKGKMIEIQHNVYAYRPYSRLHSLTGTEGYCAKYPKPGICIKGEKAPELKGLDDLEAEKFLPEDAYNELMALYEPEFVKEIKEKAKKVGGHGGMDYIMDYRLIYCLRKGLPLDEDVYDAAEWSCLTELSRLSIENGNAPVAVPDFTRGAWDKVKGFSYEF